MSRKTIVAVYDSHQEATEAVQALHHEGFTSDQISLVASDRANNAGVDSDDIDGGSKASKGMVTGGVLGGIAGLVVGLAGMTIPGLGPIVAAGPIATVLGGAVAGVLAGGIIGGLIGLGIPESEAHIYAEGLRRGNTLVGVTIPEERLDLATSVLDRFNPIDIDERANSWRQEGWERFDDTAEPMALSSTTTTQAATTTTKQAATARPANVSTDKGGVIEVLEENLVVGKREVSKGQVRVRSYVVTEPVQESVSLREEHVNVERRPVDRAVNATDAFADKTIVLDERAEEAVVAKNVRVKEEIVIGKETNTRTETITDQVRHTEVDIDRDNNMSSAYQTHFKSLGSGYGSYEEFRPAYEFGYEASSNQSYAGKKWDQLKDTVRDAWEGRHGTGTFKRHEPAIRYAYENRAQVSSR